MSADWGVYFFLFISLYFEVFLLISFLERRVKAVREAREPARYPYVGIIVPCFNEERTIAATIRSLLALDYPKEKLDIVLVNDGSRDSSPAILDRFAKRYSHVRAIHKENGGKHTALNAAIETMTNTELVGCLDADSFVAPEALKEAVMHFENPSVMAVTPAISVHEPRGMLSRIQQAEYSFAIFIRRVFSMTGSAFITPGPFSFFRKEALDAVGPYRKAHHTEDLELGLRFQEKRFHIDNAPTVRVYTTTPPTLKKLYRQRVRWTYGFLRNMEDYRHMVGNWRFGALGLLVLPSALLSIFGGIFFAGYFLVNLGSLFVDTFVQYSAAGLPNGLSAPDLFFFNTQALIFITLTLLILTTIIIGIGKRISQTGGRLAGPDLPLFLALYGFLAPLWLAGAVAKATLVRDISWR